MFERSEMFQRFNEFNVFKRLDVFFIPLAPVSKPESTRCFSLRLKYKKV
jgi:hypothetical protein